jgi:hypothetical protein
MDIGIFVDANNAHDKVTGDQSLAYFVLLVLPLSCGSLNDKPASKHPGLVRNLQH